MTQILAKFGLFVTAVAGLALVVPSVDSYPNQVQSVFDAIMPLLAKLYLVVPAITTMFTILFLVFAIEIALMIYKVTLGLIAKA